MQLRFEIRAEGHPNVRATHRTTFEITKEGHLTPRGDCIVGINAEIGISEIPQEIKGYLSLQKPVTLLLELPEYGMVEEVRAVGAKGPFDHPTDIVVRKSGYVCGRTLAVRADKAAADLSREFVELLRDRAVLLFVIVLECAHDCQGNF